MSILSFFRSRVSLAFIALGLALVLAVACNGDGDGDGDDGGGTTPAGGATAEIQMLPGITFDTDELTIDADADVTITADNTDGFHNFAVYISRDEAEDPAIEPIGQTEIESAPFVDTVTLNLAAGEYFFRCEVHPSNMTGTLIVQ